MTSFFLSQHFTILSAHCSLGFAISFVWFCFLHHLRTFYCVKFLFFFTTLKYLITTINEIDCCFQLTKYINFNIVYIRWLDFSSSCFVFVLGFVSLINLFSISLLQFQEMAINSYDIVSTLQALGMMKYWKGKHIILKKQVRINVHWFIDYSSSSGSSSSK